MSDVAPGGTGDLSTEGGMTRTRDGGSTSTGHTADITTLVFAGHMMDTCGHRGDQQLTQSANTLLIYGQR